LLKRVGVRIIKSRLYLVFFTQSSPEGKAFSPPFEKNIFFVVAQ